ncbi:MAG: ribonuclease III [Treponema sp.]|nr:ribonuclease III [Treponema sp.]
MHNDYPPIPPERQRALVDFCCRLGLSFHNLSLLDRAFYHRSYANEDAMPQCGNNERLEFLGDSVLGMAVAAFLFVDLPNKTEGELAQIKSVVVSEKVLAPVAVRCGVANLLVLGRGEDLSGGRHKPALLADCMEAVIGAYYLDAGYAAAEQFIRSIIVPEIRFVQSNHGLKDYKTLLQEWYQKKTKQCPRYELVGTRGPDHDQTFSVAVHLGSDSYGPVTGKSKKNAEQRAAEVAYRALVAPERDAERVVRTETPLF